MARDSWMGQEELCLMHATALDDCQGYETALDSWWNQEELCSDPMAGPDGHQSESTSTPWVILVINVNISLVGLVSYLVYFR